MKSQMQMSRDLVQTIPEASQMTALIPSYNRAHLISRAVSSVLNQTLPPYEIIVVDDGSTDNTREILASFGDSIRYIHQENAGSAVARHHGITAAQTDWIALLDSDDVWNPDHLERMSDAIIATDGRANYYFADTQRPQELDKQMQWHLTGFSIGEPYVLFEEGAEWVLKDLQPMMLQSTVIKRSAYMASGGFYAPLRYRDDTHLFIKLGLKDPICAVAGGGTKMTDDDQPQNRLSINYDRTRDKEGFVMQVVMFQDLLNYFDGRLTPEQKDTLSLYLANSYLNVARASWRERKFTEVAKNMLLSGVKHPRAIMDMIGRKLSVK